MWMSLKVHQRTLLPHAWKQLIAALKGQSGCSFLKVGYQLQALVHNLLDGVLPQRMASQARESMTSHKCVCEKIHSLDDLHDHTDNQLGPVDGQDPRCYQNNNDW
jgi:hypothetical protein